MKKRKFILYLIVIAVLIGGFLGLKYWMEYNVYRQQVADIEIAYVDILSVPDGIYLGQYQITWVEATVNVWVQDGVIEKIDLIEHINGQGEAAETITQRVLDAQSLQVEAVSGATSSSRVILKSIERALLIQEGVS